MKTALAITRTLSRRYYPLHPEEQEALASIMECRRVDKGELLLEEGRIALPFPLCRMRNVTSVLLQKRA